MLPENNHKIHNAVSVGHRFLYFSVTEPNFKSPFTRMKMKK